MVNLIKSLWGGRNKHRDEKKNLNENFPLGLNF